MNFDIISKKKQVITPTFYQPFITEKSQTPDYQIKMNQAPEHTNRCKIRDINSISHDHLLREAP